MRADDKDAVLDLARANLTHDELSAIEGRVEAFIRWTDPCNTKPFSGSSLQLVSDLRALLKAYQEQRRALEPFAKAAALFDAGDYVNHDACIYRPAAGDEYSLSSGHLLAARAALTGEDTATLGLSGKTQTGGDACTS